MEGFALARPAYFTKIPDPGWQATRFAEKFPQAPARQTASMANAPHANSCASPAYPSCGRHAAKSRARRPNGRLPAHTENSINFTQLSHIAIDSQILTPYIHPIVLCHLSARRKGQDAMKPQRLVPGGEFGMTLEEVNIMYSIALLMALSSGGEVADGHRKGGGCCGEVASCGKSGHGGRAHKGHGGRHGGHGCSAGCGDCGATACGGTMHHAAPAAEPVKVMPKPKVEAAAPATIVVELPADATLKVDGEATLSTSTVRVLVSPELPAGKEFHYTLTAQVVREGKPVQVEQLVTVRAGEESRVSLTLPAAGVVQR